MLSEVTRQEAKLDLSIQHFRSKAYSDNSKQAYKAMRNCYLRFCVYFGYKPVPIHQAVLTRYVVFLSRTLRPTSISSYLNVIRIIHLEAGLSNPLQQNWLVDSVIKGIKRELGTPPSKKLPITPQILQCMVKKLDLQKTQDLAFWAACLCAFFCFFRKSTLLPKSVCQFNSDKDLTRKDVKFMEQFAVLTVKQSKTLQFGDRSLQIPLPRITSSVLCPVTALEKLFAIGKVIPLSAPLFSYPDKGDDYRIITHSSFVSKLRSVLHACDMNTSAYSGHSFRRGGASFAFACGVPTSIIKLQGDWKSSAYEGYITAPLDLRMKLSRALSLKL